MPWKVEYAAQSSVKVSAVPCHYYCPGLTYNVWPATKVANFSGVALLTPAQVGIYFVYRIWSVRCGWMDDLLSRHPITAVSIYIPIPTDGIARILIRSFLNNLRVLRWYPQTKVSSQSPILSKGFRCRALLSPFLHLSVCGWLDCSEWSNNNFTSNAIWFCGFRFWLVANRRMPCHKVILGLMYYLAMVAIKPTACRIKHGTK